MNKEDIKRMANTCENYHSCALCPYNPEDISRFIGDKWKGGCPNYDRKIVYSMGKGYRKIADDEIVLKFDDLVKRDEKIKEFAKNKVTKETAREILQIVDGKLDLYRNGVIGGSLYDAGYKSAVNEIKFAVKNKFDIDLEDNDGQK